MKRLTISLRVIFALLGIALVASCVPGGPSQAEIESMIKTSVAMTVEAESKIATSVAMTVAARETEAAKALPTPIMSPTPLPTLTPFPTSPTPWTAPPSSGGGGGGGGGSTKADYSCDIIHQRPIDNTKFNRNGTFDLTFTILNTGTKTWPAGKDLVHSYGPNFIVAPAWVTLQLPEVKPGGTFNVGTYDGMAPDTKGHHVMEFKLEGGWCWPYIAIDVK